jgi:hypothetical protein
MPIQLNTAAVGRAATAPQGDRFELTRQFWQSRVGRPVSLEDARQIVENVAGFTNILAQWGKAPTEKENA